MEHRVLKQLQPHFHYWQNYDRVLASTKTVTTAALDYCYYRQSSVRGPELTWIKCSSKNYDILGPQNAFSLFEDPDVFQLTFITGYGWYCNSRFLRSFGYHQNSKCSFGYKRRLREWREHCIRRCRKNCGCGPTVDLNVTMLQSGSVIQISGLKWPWNCEIRTSLHNILGHMKMRGRYFTKLNR